MVYFFSEANVAIEHSITVAGPCRLCLGLCATGHTVLYIYIYIEREKGREGERELGDTRIEGPKPTHVKKKRKRGSGLIYIARC